MARLTDLELSKAFVPETTPSFADIARQIEANGRPEGFSSSGFDLGHCAG